MTNKEVKEEMNSKYGKSGEPSKDILTVKKALLSAKEIMDEMAKSYPTEISDLSERQAIHQIIVSKELKSRIDLLSPSFLLDMGKVMTFGIKKYFENSWKQMPINADYAAAMRHLLMFQSGELRDTETGLSHLVHAAVQIMFIYEMTKGKKDGDALF